jgi:hypothetical protein
MPMDKTNIKNELKKYFSSKLLMEQRNPVVKQDNSYLCGKSTTMPPANPAFIAALKINSRWSRFSGYIWKAALAPLAKHLYKDVKKALQKNINYIVLE